MGIPCETLSLESIPRNQDALLPEDVTDRSDVTTLEWLTKFPFGKLPLELQLHIGRFAMESGRSIEVRGQARVPKTFDTACGRCPFALAHTCAAFHQPLMRHFLRSNLFELGLDFISLLHGLKKHVSIEYTGMIESAAMCCSGVHGLIRSSHPHLWEMLPNILPSLSYLEVRIAYHVWGVEQIKSDFRTLFDVCPTLESVLFKPATPLIIKDGMAETEKVLRKLNRSSTDEYCTLSEYLEDLRFQPVQERYLPSLSSTLIELRS